MLLALFFYFLFLTNHHGNLFLKVDELLITPAPTTLGQSLQAGNTQAYKRSHDSICFKMIPMKRGERQQSL
jgi:hypothetical protein